MKNEVISKSDLIDSELLKLMHELEVHQIELEIQNEELILTKFIKNAIKLTDEGAIEFGYIQEQNTLKFHVKNTGLGIAKENLDHIYKRFYRIENEGKKVQHSSYATIQTRNNREQSRKRRNSNSKKRAYAQFKNTYC